MENSERHILVIDDNVKLTMLIATGLQKFDFHVTIENNSQFAMDLIRKLKPDLVLLDVMMPVVDGGMILSELRGDPYLRNLPVILMTGLGAEAEGLCKTGGIETPIIAKPTDLGNLVRNIERVLGQSAPKGLPR
ncbi:MAG: response regulator [Verrucomicrobiota bacterium]